MHIQSIQSIGTRVFLRAISLSLTVFIIIIAPVLTFDPLGGGLGLILFPQLPCLILTGLVRVVNKPWSDVLSRAVRRIT